MAWGLWEDKRHLKRSSAGPLRLRILRLQAYGSIWIQKIMQCKWQVRKYSHNPVSIKQHTKAAGPFPSHVSIVLFMLVVHLTLPCQRSVLHLAQCLAKQMQGPGEHSLNMDATWTLTGTF